jgi:hypothetical protein
MFQYSYLIHEGKEKVIPQDKVQKLIDLKIIKKFEGTLNNYRGNRIVSPIYTFDQGKSWADAQDILLVKPK